MVGGQRHRSMEMIDRVCVALAPSGDTLAVVVNVPDVTAKNGDEAETLSRNRQLAEGEEGVFAEEAAGGCGGAGDSKAVQGDAGVRRECRCRKCSLIAILTPVSKWMRERR